MLPCAASSVLVGSANPQTWMYSLQLYGPSSTVTRYRPRDGVVHLQAGTQPDRPWQGRAPWQTAHISGALLAGIERQLAGESESASGYILAVPDLGDKGESADASGEDDPLTALRRDLASAKGRTLLAPSMSAGFGGGPAVAPSAGMEYQARRFGADPPDALISLRRDVERSILSTYGILPSLFYERAAGTALREAARWTHSNSSLAIATLIASQLGEALGEEIAITLPRPTDMTSLARAVGSLVDSGMSIEDAREVVGL